MKVLFLIKQNNEYNEANSFISKAGLRNSARFVVEAINKFECVEALLEVLTDQNRIHGRVKAIKPDVCILEAIWVTPAKLRELIDLHPMVNFVVRVHSRTPFLSMEGNAIAYIKEYVKIATVSFNHSDTASDFERLGYSNLYLPNIYPHIEYLGVERHVRKHLYKIGCFGAIRPLKNQLSQAVAAILFAQKMKSVVHFYINSTRIEQRGESVLKAMRSLFEGTRHKLVEVPWLEHCDFLKLVGQMDACMQVSFTETFNIVTADCISQHVPVVVSPAIDWLECRKAEPTNESNIAEVLEHTIERRHEVVEDAIHDLTSYNNHSILRWFRFLKRF